LTASPVSGEDSGQAYGIRLAGNAHTPKDRLSFSEESHRQGMGNEYTEHILQPIDGYNDFAGILNCAGWIYDP
jgi:hypothetical protein